MSVHQYNEPLVNPPAQSRAPTWMVKSLGFFSAGAVGGGLGLTPALGSDKLEIGLAGLGAFLIGLLLAAAWIKMLNARAGQENSGRDRSEIERNGRDDGDQSMHIFLVLMIAAVAFVISFSTCLAVVFPQATTASHGGMP